MDIKSDPLVRKQSKTDIRDKRTGPQTDPNSPQRPKMTKHDQKCPNINKKIPNMTKT